MTTPVSAERLGLIASGIADRLAAGASGAPDLERDIASAITELLSLRATSLVFDGLPKRKLDDLIARGWNVAGYAIQNGEMRYGFITTGGFVGWWQPDSSPSVCEGEVTDEASMDTAPLDRDILVWWPIVAIDEETGDLTDTEVDGRWLVTEWNGGCWLEPEVLNALNSNYFDDDCEYARAPKFWRALPAGRQALSKGVSK